MVLEEAPEAAVAGAGSWGPSPVPLPLSAARPEALPQMAARLAGFRSGPGAPELTTAAWTLQTGREHLTSRVVVPARSRAELIARLERLADGDPDLSELATPVADACRTWLEGETVDWAALWERPPSRRVVLPSYPFERVPLGFAPEPKRAVAAVRG